MRIFNIIVLFIYLTLLASCKLSAFTDKMTSSSTNSQPCVKIKRQMLYNKTNPNMEGNWSASKQQQQLEEQYRTHHCGNT